MPNPYVNKVELADGTTIIDISGDSVATNTLLQGSTAHDKTGAPINGGVSFVTYRTGTTDPPNNLGVDGDIYLKTVS